MKQPTLASVDEYIEDRIDLSEYLTPNPESAFLIRVDGNSMADAGILSGDLLVVERGEAAKPGDIIISHINQQFIVERFHGYGLLSLVSANTEPLNAGAWGVVRFTIHRA